MSTGYYLGPQRRLSGYGGLSYGGFYGGTRKQASFRGRVELSYRLSVEPGISFNRVDTRWGVFDPRLIGARVNYAFSPRMFLGALVQHSSADGTLATNVRFRWEYLPGSDLYVVCSDGRLTGLGGMPRIETRSFAVKFTRLFRF